MKTILVPTDFSHAAGNAAEYAVSLAKKMNARVLLFHVYHLYAPISTDAPAMVMNPVQIQKENEDRLKTEVKHLQKERDVEINYLAKMGMAVDEILEEEKYADLIVMGMRGAGKLSEAFIGSITTTTLRRSKTPVLVIPDGAKYKDPEKIVFACDYDPRIDAQTLDILKKFMRTFANKIYVLNVKRKKETVTVEKDIGRSLKGELNNAEHVYYFSDKDDLVEGINEFAEEHDADMVAIIPHRYGLMEGLFHKSISKKMAFHTHVPLLALPDNHKSIAAYLI